MKALDLCCALGGWSDGLAMEGFEVIGVEIERKIARLYKHDIIVADIRTLSGENFKGFDLIIGSPPCRDFSRMCDHGKRENGSFWKWKNPKNPQRGLELVHAFLKIVSEAKPGFWLMENVPNLERYLGIKPSAVVNLRKSMKRAFWGNFPGFLVPHCGKKRIIDFQGPFRKWERAKIPLPVARALGRAIRQELSK